MKYGPAINVWASGVMDALISGRLRLQPGQWIKCGENAQPSRFCGVTPTGTVVATHPEGGRLVDGRIVGNKVDPARFRGHLAYARSRMA